MYAIRQNTTDSVDYFPPPFFFAVVYLSPLFFLHFAHFSTTTHKKEPLEKNCESTAKTSEEISEEISEENSKEHTRYEINYPPGAQEYSGESTYAVYYWKETSARNHEIIYETKCQKEPSEEPKEEDSEEPTEKKFGGDCEIM